VRYIYALLFASLPAFAGNVTCTGASGTDSYAIQASLNATGTTTLINTGHHCVIGTTTLGTEAAGTTLTTSTGAQVDYSGSGYALNINHNSVTVTNITWNGGGLHTTQRSTSTPQSGVTITGNTINNVTNGSNGIQSDGYWSGFTISNNTFNTISTVPLGSVTTATDVENGGGYKCTYPGGCYGLGIDNENGMNATTINNNIFNFTLGDAIRIAYNWTLSSGTSYHTAANNSISYNRFTDIHRMAIESQGATGCVGSCNYGNASFITGLKIAGNYAYNFVAPYGNTFAYSVPIGAAAPYVINNTGVLAATGSTGYGLEDGNNDEIAQGNVLSSSDTATPWYVYIMSGWASSGHKITHQNNVAMGALRGNGAYISNEGTNYGGSFLNQYNMTGVDCQTPSTCQTSKLALAFSTANNQTFSAHGDGTWQVYVTDQISIKYVQFFIDGSATAAAAQEIQDVSTTFAADGKWLYHYMFDTGTLADGSHTIKATATDVSGATSSVTEGFTVGGGGTTGGTPPTNPTPLAAGTYNIKDASGLTMDGGFEHYSSDTSMYLYAYNDGIDQKITFTAAAKLLDVGTGLYLFNSGGILKQGVAGDTFVVTKPVGDSGYLIEDGSLYVASPGASGPPNTLHLSSTAYVWTIATAP
jgi:hypothetical protein